MLKFPFKNKRTYIIPTWFGLGYAGTCLILFSMSFAFNSNFSYFLSFLIASLAVFSMPITNKNIQQLYITDIDIDPYESGHPGMAQVKIKNNGTWAAQNVLIDLDGDEYFIEVIQPNEEVEVNLMLKPQKRGEYLVPRVRLQSVFPFNLLKSWKYYYSDSKYYVFPLRKGESQWPARSTSNLEGSQRSSSNQDVFNGHRQYTNRDAMTKIDWRVWARTQELVVKQFEGFSQLKAEFSWEQTAHLKDFETRLSQLSLWISEAENTGAEYSLQLLHYKMPRARGFDHYNDIMAKLSVFNAQ